MPRAGGNQVVPRSALPASDIRLRPLRILLATNDDTLCANLVTVLDNLDIQYDTAEDGASALHKLQQQSFSAVIMDMHLPVLDGYETLRWIRRDPKLKALSVLALTSETLRYEADACMAAGCDLYQAKPCSLATLGPKVQELVTLIRRQHAERTAAERPRSALFSS